MIRNWRTRKELAWLLRSADAHDATEKVVLGHTLKAGRGMEDGLEVLEVLIKVCDTLAFAHSHGVIHRDLKPPNIMVYKIKDKSMQYESEQLAKDKARDAMMIAERRANTVQNALRGEAPRLAAALR